MFWVWCVMCVAWCVCVCGLLKLCSPLLGGRVTVYMAAKQEVCVCVLVRVCVVCMWVCVCDFVPQEGNDCNNVLWRISVCSYVHSTVSFTRTYLSLQMTTKLLLCQRQWGKNGRAQESSQWYLSLLHWGTLTLSQVAHVPVSWQLIRTVLDTFWVL